MTGRMLGVALLIAVGGVGVAALLGSYRWNAATRDLRARLAASRASVKPDTVSASALDGLPPPARRFLETALTDGQPTVVAVRLHHRGTFNLSETGDRWRPFTSDQLVITRRPGFDWDARINVMPGLPVRVHDAYVAGEGTLHASVLGVFAVARIRGGGEIAAGELMRFLAEAVWYPTALLPGQGLRWEPAGDHSARATLVDGPVSVSLLFTFDSSGLPETVRAEARGRTAEGTVIPTPWQGRFSNYQTRSGMRIPLDGEVEWLLPTGPAPYWRGHLTDIQFEFAR